ncbi:hypothetical protein BHE74_00050535, partial [Ensete ventricosum]
MDLTEFAKPCAPFRQTCRLSWNQGLQFRPVPPSTGGTYRSARLPVRGPSATRRFRQKSTVGGRLRKKKGRRRGKEKKRREERVPRPRAILARLTVSPHGEKDRGD